MRPPGNHLSYIILADLAEGRTPLSDDVRAHLDSCGRCAADLVWLNRLLDLARDAPLEEPPAAAVEHIKELFRAFRRPVSLGQRLIQALPRFDSAFSTPAFGLRSAATSERQILLDAEGYLVDLRITPDGDRLAVAGQLLGAGSAPPGAITVELFGARASVRAALNELNEFALDPVPPGRYSLTITLDDGVIHVPELDLGT